MKKYAEEDYARVLEGQLSRELAWRLPGATASVSGEGCHWNCRAAREQRSCTIHCFDGPCYRPGPEFLVRFEEQSARPMWGRTLEQAEVIGAVCAWLNRQSAQELYSQFAFVEQHRRELAKIQHEIIKAQPELTTLTTREVVSSDGSECGALWFRTADRSCEIGGHAHAKFYWDGCLQFSIQSANTISLAALLTHWLCDHAMPSAVQREFPSVALSDVAQYYEQSRGIEGEFIVSWCHVESFYKDVQHPFALRVLNFISQLRAAGYERTLRAGTSLFSLLVSRSRRHGLESGQPYIAFSFGGARFTSSAVAPGAMEVAVYFDGRERKVAFSNVELNGDLNALLKQLEAKTIS
jgi:hypothetical protein